MHIDYDNCITNLSNSVLKYFDCDTYHNTITRLDDLLKEDNPKNVVLILCDGMGSHILDSKLHENDFLIKHRISTITSVFPPTTTASTTSMLSGLNPNEHGWLGWDLYFEKEDKIVTMFSNCIKDTTTLASKENLASKYYSYKSIIELINEKHKAERLMSFLYNPDNVFDNMLDKAKKMCEEEGKKFIYVYYTEPDTITHEFGQEDDRVTNMYRSINDKISSFCNSVKDTDVIVTADHGHITCEPIKLTDYPDFISTLDGDVSIEGRACSFKVKDKDRFVIVFNKYFKNDFDLYTKEEVINNHLFGYGTNHKYFEGSLGDFIAIATTNKYFRYNDDSVLLKSMHAGSLDIETQIPLILYRKK